MGNVNVLDPNVWSSLPESTRASAMQQLQGEMVFSALKGGSGDFLIRMREQRRAAGQDMSNMVFVIAHKSDTLVSDDVREKMSSEQLYWVGLVDARGESLPPNGTAAFYEKMKVAKSTSPKPDDMWTLYCSEGQAFLAPLSLDRFIRNVAEDKAKDEEDAVIAADAAKAAQEMLAAVEAKTADEAAEDKTASVQAPPADPPTDGTV